MKTFLRIVLALILGFVLGGVVNMGLVIAGPHVIPPPAGVDVTKAETLAASIHLLQPKHFLFPFLAHALGTLVAAFIACLVAGGRPGMIIAWAFGMLFLIGGITATFIIPAPMWFIVLDLLGAYLPMAWLGIVLARKVTGGTRPPDGLV